MSKKKGTTPKKKAPVKKAPVRKAAAKAPVKKKASLITRMAAAVLPAPAKRTTAATIFVFKTDGGYRVRTSPQLISAAPGYVEWTVVNLVSDDAIDVEITWPADGPWGGKPIRIVGGNARISLADAKEGKFKYNVTAMGYTEDPEIEYPEGI